MASSNKHFDCIFQGLFLQFQSTNFSQLLVFPVFSAELNFLADTFSSKGKKCNREVSNRNSLLEKVLRLPVVLVCGRSVPRFINEKQRSGWLSSHIIHGLEN